MSQTYPSDLTDAQWAILEPLVPTTHEGRPRTVDLRKILNGIFYRCRSGCQWRMLPKEYGPYQTVYNYYRHWVRCGVWERMNAALREAVRAAPVPECGRPGQPDGEGHRGRRGPGVRPSPEGDRGREEAAHRRGYAGVVAGRGGHRGGGE